MEDKATQTPEQTFSMEAALQETEARLEKRVRPGQILSLHNRQLCVVVHQDRCLLSWIYHYCLSL